MHSQNSIPVIYYHSVGNHSIKKPWSFLTCDLKTFELQMKALKYFGFKTCSMKQLDDHVSGLTRLPKKTIHIQFDDGFLDNWAIVYPIMKKLEFKFTILVTPDFISKHERRKFCSNPTESNLSEWWGYLSEQELIELDKDPLVDIQAHGYSHTWYASSKKIIGVNKDTNLNPWIHWNENVSKKSSWLNDPELIGNYKLGYPIFENEKSLSNEKAFLPNKKFIEKCINLYIENKKISTSEVSLIADEFDKNGELGRFENVNETNERYRVELEGTRNYLEKILGRSVDYLVWPGGGNSEKTVNLALDYGYKLVSKGNKLNDFGSGVKQISRVAAFIQFKPKILSPYLNLILIFVQISRASGNILIAKIVNFLKKVIQK